jgi:uncharacterized protein
LIISKANSPNFPTAFGSYTARRDERSPHGEDAGIGARSRTLRERVESFSRRYTAPICRRCAWLFCIYNLIDGSTVESYIRTNPISELMAIEFDAAKDAVNIEKHGVSLARASDFEILAFLEDGRSDYGETRYRAWGLIDGRPYCLAFTNRNGVVRAISLRRAHAKEMKRYVAQNADR